MQHLQKTGGGSYRFFRTFGRSDLSTFRRLPGVHSRSCTLWLLFASKVFHISFAINPFHTLSKNCRGVTQQFPLKLVARHSSLTTVLKLFLLTHLQMPPPANPFLWHPYKRPGGGRGRSLFCTLLSLFASRVFHNSFPINRFHTLSQKCRGVTQQFPF